ncbi:MAG: hypothetical protein MJ133_10255, partial [Lachnospiraceae bacterium]|nr:hypothetical protein [Lachnospiraceae bacterium]
MKNNTLKAMGIAIGAALSLMMATGVDAKADETIIPEGFDEVKDDTDYNEDGDKKDTCEVSEVPGAMDMVDKGTVQLGDAGLTDPVLIATVTETNDLGDNMTKTEVDEKVAALDPKYTDIQITPDDVNTEKAIEEAKTELVNRYKEDGITEADIERKDGEDTTVVS